MVIAPSSFGEPTDLIKGCAMQSKSDFWLTLHKLDNDLAKEGGTNNDRAESICKVLCALPASAQAFYLSNLETAVSALTEIMRRCGHQEPAAR
jgi:hypothetical protein